MLSKRMKFIIVCLVIISIVMISSALWILSQGYSTNDYFATYTIFDHIA